MGSQSLPIVYPGAFSLLCEVLSSPAVSPRAIDALRDPERRKALLILAEQERVAAALHGAIATRYSNVLPRIERAVLATHQEAYRRRNAEFRRALLELGVAGESADIRFIPLKGAAWLIENEAGDVSWRQMIDLDVLIQPKQFDLAPRLLEAIGYSLASTEKRFRDNFHFAPYQHPTIPVTIEIHRHLGWRHQLLPPDMLFADARAAAPGLWLAAPWMRLFHAVIHWQEQDHGRSRGSLPIKDLIEVAQFLGRKDVDWATFATHADRVGERSACENAIASAHMLLGAPIPQQFEPTTRARRWVVNSTARRESPLGIWLATQKFRAGTLWWCDKVRYRGALREMSPAVIALRVWVARIARLPLLAARTAAIAVQALAWASSARRVRRDTL